MAVFFEQRSLYFSDTIIRVTPLYAKRNVNYPVGLLYHELNDLVWIQSELAKKGVFIRGSITIDESYVKNDVFFGPGIIKAYKIERELANYPRIIVDPDRTQFINAEALEKLPIIKSSLNSGKNEEAYIRELLRKDEDGELFIDYLKTVFSEMFFSGEDANFIDFLREHKRQIKKNLKNFQSNRRVCQKYEWLKTYHNNVVVEISDSIKKMGYKPKTLLI